MTGDTFNRPPEPFDEQRHGEPVVNAPDDPRHGAVPPTALGLEALAGRAAAALAQAMRALAGRGPTLLDLAADRCSRVADVYGALTAALSCQHLPVLPAEIGRVNDWDTLTRIEKAATSIASTVETSRRRDQCACDATALSGPIRDLWTTLAEMLSAIRCTLTGEKALTGRLSRSLAALDQRLEAVNAATDTLAERVATAKTAVEESTALIKGVFDRIADAGCAHSPAAVTNARLRDDAAAIGQANRLSWRINYAIEDAVYHEADEGGREHASQCCDALTTATSAALFRAVDWWAHTTLAAWQYVIHGKEATRMVENRRELQLAIEEMFEQF